MKCPYLNNIESQPKVFSKLDHCDKFFIKDPYDIVTY